MYVSMSSSLCCETGGLLFCGGDGRNVHVAPPCSCHFAINVFGMSFIQTFGLANRQPPNFLSSVLRHNCWIFSGVTVRVRALIPSAFAHVGGMVTCSAICSGGWSSGVQHTVLWCCGCFSRLWSLVVMFPTCTVERPCKSCFDDSFELYCESGMLCKYCSSGGIRAGGVFTTFGDFRFG
jgi:hypothetical protein